MVFQDRRPLPLEMSTPLAVSAPGKGVSYAVESLGAGDDQVSGQSGSGGRDVGASLFRLDNWILVLVSGGIQSQSSG